MHHAPYYHQIAIFHWLLFNFLFKNFDCKTNPNLIKIKHRDHAHRFQLDEYIFLDMWIIKIEAFLAKQLISRGPNFSIRTSVVEVLLSRCRPGLDQRHRWRCGHTSAGVINPPAASLCVLHSLLNLSSVFQGVLFQHIHP